MKRVFAYLARNLWIYVILAFLILIAAYTTVILIVPKSMTEEIKVPTQTPSR